MYWSRQDVVDAHFIYAFHFYDEEIMKKVLRGKLLPRESVQIQPQLRNVSKNARTMYKQLVLRKNRK